MYAALSARNAYRDVQLVLVLLLIGRKWRDIFWDGSGPLLENIGHFFF